MGFNGAFRTAGVRAYAGGMGSLVVLHRREEPIRTSLETVFTMAAARDVPKLLHLEMLTRSVFAASRGQFAVSTPMTDCEIDEAVGVFGDTLQLLRPVIAEQAPQLPHE